MMGRCSFRREPGNLPCLTTNILQSSGIRAVGRLYNCFLYMTKRYAALLLLAFLVMTVCGQDKKQKKEDITTKVHNLNPIVVTGNGHHEYLRSSTTPVHVLPQREIQKQGTSTFTDILTRMAPNISFMPSATGSFLRMNGLSNKYILILVNGKKMMGDISGNVDIDRINMGQIKRIEVLNGAASALYGSDAMGGVINIITDFPKNQLVNVNTHSRVSGKGVFSQSANVNVNYKGFGSYTSYKHDEADSYRMNDYEYVDGKGESPETQLTHAMQFLGYHSDVINQRFTYESFKNMSFYADLGISWKMTDRPRKEEGWTGGFDYELRTRATRWGAGTMYKFTRKHSLQMDLISDHWHYGKEYMVDDGDFSITKKQKMYNVEIKDIHKHTAHSTTIVGATWRNDFLMATSGNVDNHAYIMSLFGQHDMQIIDHLQATIGLRYDKHQTFGSNITPKITMMYAPEHFNFRVGYSKGFRAPGLDEVYYHYVNPSMAGRVVVTFGNKDLKPEKNDYYSLSASYYNQRLTLTATGYVNHINKMIIKDNVKIGAAEKELLLREFPDELNETLVNKMSTFGQYKNSDEGLIRGFSLNASYNLTNDLNITANYAYTYARSKTDGAWREIERSLRNVVTFAADYNHTWGNYHLNVNMNGRFQSRTPFPAYEDAPGFGLMNINTTHTFSLKRLTLSPSLGIDNILDKVDRRIDTSKRRYALITPGRMVVVGIKLNFDN